MAGHRTRPGEKDGASTYKSLQGQLRQQLVMVRGQFQEAVACYSLRVQAMLAEVGDALAADQRDGLSPADLQVRLRSLARAIEEIERLELKPARGRRKDLKAVQSVAIYLREVVTDQG